jgi:hypothetical protein
VPEEEADDSDAGLSPGAAQAATTSVDRRMIQKRRRTTLSRFLPYKL